MTKEKLFRVDYCLNQEQDFEDFHPAYNKLNNELFISMKLIKELVLKCLTEDDTVGIGIEAKGNWDTLEIHGVDGSLYTLEYQIGIEGGSFFKEGVTFDEIETTLENIKQPMSDFQANGFTFKHW